MLERGKVNPFNVLGLRRIEYCPPYFEVVVITPSYNLNSAIDDWIFSNLSGRYYVGTTIDTTESSGLKQKLRIGFETSKEMSYFMLACPHLKY
jgi:hypothetical protein